MDERRTPARSNETGHGVIRELELELGITATRELEEMGADNDGKIPACTTQQFESYESRYEVCGLDCRVVTGCLRLLAVSETVCSGPQSSPHSSYTCSACLVRLKESQ